MPLPHAIALLRISSGAPNPLPALLMPEPLNMRLRIVPRMISQPSAQNDVKTIQSARSVPWLASTSFDIKRNMVT